MAETCENCGKPMKDWAATHCSEECLLDDIRNSVRLHGDVEFDKLIKKMRKENRYDIYQLS